MGLADIRKKSKQKPPRIIVHGGPAIGKTHLASQTKNPILLDVEDGLGKIEMDNIRCKSFEDVMENLNELAQETHDYKTVCVDSLDWLENLLWEKACQDNGWKSIDQPSFGKGYTETLTYWRKYIHALNVLREKGMMIFQICHSEVRKVEDPRIEPYDRYSLKLHRKASALLLEHSDACFFAAKKLGTIKVQGKSGGMTTKTVSGDRIIYTNEEPAFLAKNRYNLPDEIPMDWETIRGEMLK
jgi:hypothetical protein